LFVVQVCSQRSGHAVFTVASRELETSSFCVVFLLYQYLVFGHWKFFWYVQQDFEKVAKELLNNPEVLKPNQDRSLLPNEIQYRRDNEGASQVTLTTISLIPIEYVKADLQ
jgi:hypothetical protein